MLYTHLILVNLPARIIASYLVSAGGRPREGGQQQGAGPAVRRGPQPGGASSGQQQAPSGEDS